MKPILSILFLFITQFVSAQSQNAFDYTIILGACFKNDKVTMMINNRTVFKNYLINNVDTSKKGNLNLVQDDNGIRINFNGNGENRRYIPFKFVLNIKMIVNDQVEKFSIDLRKGNIILFDYCPVNEPHGVPSHKLTAEQLQEPFLFM